MLAIVANRVCFVTFDAAALAGCTTMTGLAMRTSLVVFCLVGADSTIFEYCLFIEDADWATLRVERRTGRAELVEVALLEELLALEETQKLDLQVELRYMILARLHYSGKVKTGVGKDEFELRS